MKFKLKFVIHDLGEYEMANNYTAGLIELDRARAVLGDAITSAEYEPIPRKVILEMTEQQARECFPAFNRTQEFCVSIQKKDIESFCRWCTHSDDKSRAIERLDLIALRQSWIDSGCPRSFKAKSQVESKKKREWSRLLRPFYGKVETGNQ